MFSHKAKQALLKEHRYKTKKYTYVADKTYNGRIVIWRYPIGQRRLIDLCAGYASEKEFERIMNDD